MTTTTVTDQIFRLAEKAGLRPKWCDPYRNVRAIALNGEGVNAPFGTVQVGVNSGKVLRAEITYGNSGPTKHYSGAREVQAALKALAG